MPFGYNIRGEIGSQKPHNFFIKFIYKIWTWIHQLLYNFLSDGRGDKIKKSVILNENKDGGLKMLDIRSFNHALILNWVKKYLDDNNQAKWKRFFLLFY